MSNDEIFIITASTKHHDSNVFLNAPRKKGIQQTLMRGSLGGSLEVNGILFLLRREGRKKNVNISVVDTMKRKE